ACGTPVVTLPGSFLRSRITAALYQRMGLETLIAADNDDYVRRALEWAGNPTRQAEVRQQIQQSSAILFENADEVRCLEATLRQLMN
ncbi:MAG: hypothetical protein KDA85_22630, partial [Planctomycetaceae bacterium]|nr:hypothetical protein [Planctomycetaceae bacterium]